MKTNGHIMYAGLALAVAVGLLVPSSGGAQSRTTEAGWVAPQTPWGDPDLQGTYTNNQEANTPLERPEQFRGRALEELGADDLAGLTEQRLAQAARRAAAAGGVETGAGPTHWYEHLQGAGTRPWLIVDPREGTIPSLTPRAAQKEAAIATLNGARNAEGRADSWLDRSMWDRCISRGLPGSMLPTIYGNTYEIVQSPGYVVIRYEMVHEARIIPLDARPPVGRTIRQYLGDARGRWEGSTLVVETTNFTDRTHLGYNNRYNSERLRLIERFTPIAPDTLEWEATLDDPDTWTRPWTFAMPLTRDDSQQIFEYACHEGNRGLENILRAAREEERAGRPR
jgi:hypothetical protein